MAVPKLDAPLAEFSTNFLARGSSAPQDFHLTVEQMDQYAILHEAFMSSYYACKAEGARCKSLCAAKDENKRRLQKYARSLYRIVQVWPDVSIANKVLMGVVIAKSPSPIPKPQRAPILSVISVVGRQVQVQLADASAPTTRRRPIEAYGAIIVTFAGDNPPSPGDPRWSRCRQTGRTRLLIEFPTTVAPGTPCLIAARWYNRKGQYSPWSEPVMTYLQVGPAQIESRQLEPVRLAA